MYRQELELSEKRQSEERNRARKEAAIELLNRLEKIKLQELASKRPKEVVFTASVQGSGLRFPWDEAEQAGNAPGFNESLSQAERSEFAQREPADACRKYRAALAAARNPVEKAYATLSLARALEAAGGARAALDYYRQLLSDSAADEFGVPFALYAASRLAAGGHPIQSVLEHEVNRPCCRPLTAMYLLRDLAHKSGAAAWTAPIESRIHMLEQAESLRGAVAKLLPRISGPETAWAVYGDTPWLVGPSSPATLLVIDARPVLSTLSKHPEISATGEPLGAEFIGLRLAFPPVPAANTSAMLGRLFLILLTLVAFMAVLGAYLLFRDMRRELHLAQLRSQFVSSVSHELKTPLTAIRMFAENLQSRPEAAPMQSEYLDIIVNESERLSRLVENVLDFSKIEQGSKLYIMRAVRLGEVVRAAARTVEYPMAQKGFTLKVEAEDEIEPVRADADALKQAILNLLINAMKYSGASREIGLCLTEMNRQARIRVWDRGIGIPPEQQQHIFERFYRVPSPENKLVSGAGLGLALVQHIAKAHGGSVDVESAPGQGSAFTIRLPLESRA